MNADDLDDLIRGSDPVSGNCDDTEGFAETHRQQWNELCARRRVNRKRLSWAVAAMAFFAVGGMTLERLSHQSTSGNRSDRVAAAVDRDRENTLSGEALSGEALAGKPPWKPDTQNVPQEVRQPSPGDVGEALPSQLARRNVMRREERSLQQSFDAYQSLISRAGSPGGSTWRDACLFFQRQSPSTLAAAVRMTEMLENPDQRETALELICQASPQTKRWAVTRWLENDSMRPLVWRKLVNETPAESLDGLARIAKSPDERIQICDAVAKCDDRSAADWLLALATDPTWRPAVRRSAVLLDEIKIHALIRSMRHPGQQTRTAAAFVLASVPGDRVDRIVAAMITDGRYRHPGYLVLLSRDTPQARSFLRQTAGHPNLSPALASARLHFANLQPKLLQWIRQSQGPQDEKYDATQKSVPASAFVERLADVDSRAVRSVGRPVRRS